MRQLTFEDAQQLMAPQFSPHGDRILYWVYSYTSGVQIFVCNADGSEPVQITHFHGVTLFAGSKWSGDGKAIAYSDVRRDTIPMRPDSTHIVSNIFIHDLGKDTGQIVGVGFLVDWSSDRKYMLFVRDWDNTNKHFLALTTSLNEPIREINSKAAPVFTLDSKYILYSDAARIWSISIDNGKQSLLFKLPKDFMNFVILGEMFDGKSIGILTYDKDIRRIIKVSNSGAEPETLIEVPGDINGLSYSPDTKTIVGSRLETRNKIVIIDNFR